MGETDNGRNLPCFISSMSVEANINDCIITTEHQLSVTAVLHYCKRKILNPYLRLLSIVGLRPLISNHHETRWYVQCLNHFYVLQLMVLLIFGYVLQYMACFRRDRGFCFKLTNTSNELTRIYDRICHAPIIFSFAIPSAFHLIGFLYAMFSIRNSDDDQLPLLMERVFLTSSESSNAIHCQKKLVKTLWSFIVIMSIWMILSVIAVTSMMAEGVITFKWLENTPWGMSISLKILLVTSTFSHDIVQSTIISNYCLQAQLLTVYLQVLREKLLVQSIQTIDWIRHIETFKKTLNYLNNEVAPSVCLLTFVNIACASSGILWFFNYDHVDKETVPIFGISTLNVLLWVVLALAPFIQASRLSSACDVLRSAGQQARTRPFVHQDTSRNDLDSILLYTGSLKLRAKLFCAPITGRYLSLFFLFVGIIVLVLGQCHYFNLN